ncbi:MAG: hypothetical protein AAF570_10590, partial [Bacteroidota bacterium]
MKKELAAWRERGEPDPPYVSCLPNFRVEGQVACVYSPSDTIVPDYETAKTNNMDFSTAPATPSKQILSIMEAEKRLADLVPELKNMSTLSFAPGKIDEKSSTVLKSATENLRLQTQISRDAA